MGNRFGNLTSKGSSTTQILLQNRILRTSLTKKDINFANSSQRPTPSIAFHIPTPNRVITFTTGSVLHFWDRIIVLGFFVVFSNGCFWWDFNWRVALLTDLVGFRFYKLVGFLILHFYFCTLSTLVKSSFSIKKKKKKELVK